MPIRHYTSKFHSRRGWRSGALRISIYLRGPLQLSVPLDYGQCEGLEMWERALSTVPHAFYISIRSKTNPRLRGDGAARLCTIISNLNKSRMQRFSFALCFGLSAMMLTAPCAAASDGGHDDVVRLDRNSRYDYRPGQVIVKFKDSSRVNLPARSGAPYRSAGVSAVDRAFAAIGVTGVENLMPLTGDATLRHSAPGINGRPVEAHSMARAYVLTISGDVAGAVSVLSDLADVEYAEPNYLVHALEAEVPDDPFYNQQWGLNDINMFKLWGQPVLSKEGPVVAIIDTGVDIMHPDLKDNIWSNPRELAGAGGFDDDDNGFTDDVHGWDFVNNSGVLADYNGHGTHCAGIAAAVGNNGLGIVGANPDARIMPLTALQSNGTGDMATIIKAVDYAIANGAAIISMSLGSYAESKALEEALGRAYQKCVLVAAAGNDGYCLNHPHPSKGQLTPMPMFPAAYSFVLGVQAANDHHTLADFSNYDDDGATFSTYSEEKLYNYEITAPGVSIVSTYPNGNYRQLNGTSMATPLVAGALSRLLMCKIVENKEELFGDLISACNGGMLDIYAAYAMTDADRTPDLQLVSVRVDDSEGDGDGRIDAGETIRFYPTLRNVFGNARNIRYSIEFAEEANTVCEILDKEAEFGLNLSAYGKGVAVNPVTVRLNSNVADGRICRFRIAATCDGMPEPLSQEFQLTAENGVEIGGLIRENTTLHPNVNYIVTNQLVVPEGVTLTMEPGVIVSFKDGTGLYAEGQVVAIGKPENMIIFRQASHSQRNINQFYVNSNSKLEYCKFDDIDIYSHVSFAFQVYGKHIIVSGCRILEIYGNLSDSNIEGNYIINNQLNIGENVNYISNIMYYNKPEKSPKFTEFKHSNSFGNYGDTEFEGERLYFSTYCKDQVGVVYQENPSYFGTSSRDIVKYWIWDINNPRNGFCQPGSSAYVSNVECDLSNMLTRPVAEAHGIVWKIVVDGYDAQDEFDMLPPLGVGRHKFEVYFNRPMDKTSTPSICMGVREPYTQTAIGEDGSWNEAGDVYTAYLTIGGRQNIDGLNRIYVYGARDNEQFELIPEYSRFNVNVQAAGSLSSGFMGESGVGCVKLQWEEMDANIDDILGYNLYRSTVGGDTVCVNERLIEPDVTAYTDYDVTTGTTYLYHYKVMTTSLTENSSSKTVAVTPLTAEMGDANGSGDVDVLDVLTTVNYIGGARPKPFLFDAADMNTDEDINILDVVGIAHRVLDGPAAAASSQGMPQTAYWWIEDGHLYIRSNDAIGGLQVQLRADRNSAVIAPGSSLAALETMGQWRGDDEYVFLAFSVGGASLAPGEYAVLDIDGSFSVDKIVLSDTSVNPQEIPVEEAPGHSGVDNVVVSDSIDAGAAGIYNTLGVKVADDASALDRLPAGIYIVDGKKTIVR